MNELIAAYWPFLLVAFLIGIAVAWFVFVANRKASVISVEPKKDVLDEGGSPAKRNHALIDAPKAVSQDVGQMSANANSDAVAAAPAIADAEAGPAITPSQPVKAAPATPNIVGGDDLTVIKGLGPKIAALLNNLGITTYKQIADWDDAEIDRIDAQLDRFAGRIRRDNWVDQAKLLTKGDADGFADLFGNR